MISLSAAQMESLISKIVKLPENHPLQQYATAAPPMVWTYVKNSSRADLVKPSQLDEWDAILRGTPRRARFGISGHTFSPLPTPGVKELLQSVGEIELPEVEGHLEGIQVFLSTVGVLSAVTSPRQKITFAKTLAHSKQLLTLSKGILKLVAKSHPSLHKLEPGLDALAFVVKTTQGVYTLIYELKSEKTARSEGSRAAIPASQRS